MIECSDEVMDAVTRTQMIESGNLVDVSETAAEAGFTIPTAITRAAWADCVQWSSEDSEVQTYQDQSGRLWDVVWMASMAARRGAQSSMVAFQLFRVPRNGWSLEARVTTLVLHIGPGDDGDPVITIMLPGESEADG